ncbi:hypoxanthine-guanine phosphoribosyltransferase [Sedimenticola sp.]|uniref:hypoxanthine-guanine phosphoribosyltransferase n=1 Tax=Sedimenticola sp. TaxID=1940285 RepID=UPI003D0DA721
MTISREEALAVRANADLLCTSEQVNAALADLAGRISREYADKQPIILCVMTGALIPAGQLLPLLDFPLEIDYCHATRYGANTSGGKLHWIREPALTLRGRHVLVFDDILDEGVTLAAILQYCQHAGAESVGCAVLVEKSHQRKAEGIHADYIGLTVDDRYVFGAGMDYKGCWRNLSGIYALGE